MSKLAKNTFMLMIVTMLAKILGFAREQVLAYSYDSMITDVYITVNNIPSTLFASIGAALLTTFIPIYIEVRSNKGEERALDFSNNVLSITTIICIVFVSVGLVFTEPLVKLFAVGFEGEKLRIAIEFTKIILIGIVFIGISNLMTAYLNVKNNFVIPGIVTLPQNIIVILSMILSLKYGIKVMMWGALLGIASQCLFQMPFVLKEGYKLNPKIDLKDEYLRKMVILVIPIFIGGAVNQINSMVDRSLASTLVDGSISALNYANRLNEFVVAMFINSIVTVLYPTLAALSMKSNNSEFMSTIKKSLNTIIILVFPISIGAIALAHPIVKILFERGEFTPQLTQMTSISLIMYSVGMVAVGLRVILSKIFYSIKDTKTPMINGVISVIINIVLNLILIKPFGYAGLAISTSISSIVTIIILFLKLNKKVGDFGYVNIIKTTIKSLVASVLMGIIAYITFNVISSYIGTSITSSIISVGISVILGAIVYGVLLIVLKIEEVKDILMLIKKKIKR